jgi:hypothetical protein
VSLHIHFILFISDLLSTHSISPYDSSNDTESHDLFFPLQLSAAPMSLSETSARSSTTEWCAYSAAQSHSMSILSRALSLVHPYSLAGSYSHPDFTSDNFFKIDL